MRLNLKSLSLSLLALAIILLGCFHIYSELVNKKSYLIKFNDDNLSSSFKLDITQNINDINNFLENYNFIKKYIVKKEYSDIEITISIKKPFAKNNLNQEIIFYDNSIASFVFFNQSFIDGINLVDTSQNTLQINNYLKESFDDLNQIFDINQIEFIDERRYDLIIKNNSKIMLPKIIDKKLTQFIKKNINLFKNDNVFREYLDFRNFNYKTIRMK